MSCDIATGTDDFQPIRSEVQDLVGVWQSFAHGLGLMPSDVKEIDLGQRGDPSRCLDAVVEKWLNQDYKTEKFGTPSWKGIVVSVKQSGNPALAKRIAAAHPRELTCVLCVCVCFVCACCVCVCVCVCVCMLCVYVCVYTLISTN